MERRAGSLSDGPGQGQNESKGQGHEGRGQGSWKDELHDFLRAFSGAFIFATPLLYTMEMWWIGTYADLWKLLVFLGAAFMVGLGLAHSGGTGFKRRKDLFGALEQAVDVVVVGLAGAVVVLLVLNRIDLAGPLDSILGQVIIQAVPLSIGASVANAIFGAGGQRSRESGKSGGVQGGPARAFFRDLGATVIGGLFIGFTVAPTAEIPLLAAEMDYAHEMGLIGLSLLLSYTIVFVSGFGSGQGQQAGLFQRPLTETALTYVVSLLVALGALYLFDRIEPGDPLAHVVSMVLVLGFPTTVGGAAGRLVV